LCRIFSAAQRRMRWVLPTESDDAFVSGEVTNVGEPPSVAGTSMVTVQAAFGFALLAKLGHDIARKP
jgi:hypothetical protein